jgi:hypothetical protein
VFHFHHFLLYSHGLVSISASDVRILSSEIKGGNDSSSSALTVPAHGPAEQSSVQEGSSMDVADFLKTVLSNLVRA